MGAIEESFLELASAIQKQRLADVALDEICKDFELLMSDLNELPDKKTQDDCQIQIDLHNSLEGLRQEILTRLRET